MSLLSYLEAAPKAELHVHLEGSIQPATLLTLARRNRVALPAETVSGLREWFRFSNFDHFIEVYLTITRCLRTAEDYELIVHEFGTEMARQNVRYAEVTFTPGTHERMGIAREAYFAGLARGAARVREEYGAEIRWVFDIARNASDIEDHCEETLSAALEGRAIGVVALGLGGKEAGHPPDSFRPWFDRARGEGLRIVPHAGETAGPESVWGAINELGAERIGHGVRAIDDPRLVEHLAARRIPLEVCPTSNIRLGVYPSLAAHPLRRLREAGVIVTINSDDPPLFNTTLGDEVATLAGPFGFTVGEIDEILLDAVRVSFLSDEEKRVLESSFRSSMDRLKVLHAPEGG